MLPIPVLSQYIDLDLVWITADWEAAIAAESARTKPKPDMDVATLADWAHFWADIRAANRD